MHRSHDRPRHLGRRCLPCRERISLSVLLNRFLIALPSICQRSDRFLTHDVSPRRPKLLSPFTNSHPNPAQHFHAHFLGSFVDQEDARSSRWLPSRSPFQRSPDGLQIQLDLCPASFRESPFYLKASLFPETDFLGFQYTPKAAKEILTGTGKLALYTTDRHPTNSTVKSLHPFAACKEAFLDRDSFNVFCSYPAGSNSLAEAR